MSGSLLLGFLLSVTTERLLVSPEARLLLVIGFLGSYTTFSTYAFESVALFRGGGLWSGLVNVLGNNLVGLVCALLGAYLARLVG